MNEIGALVEKYNIYNGKMAVQRLNESCPVAMVTPGFSPERIIDLSKNDPGALLKSTLIWECLACGLCRQLTDGKVDMSRFIREVRIHAAAGGYFGTETHGGLLMSVQRINATSALHPKRTDWITKPLRVVHGKGKYLYWVGGAPFFSAVMPELGSAALDSARAAILLLNHLGVKPVVLEDERFSGHDLLWTGNKEGFLALARKNLKAIMGSGADVVIVSSPEDYYTLGRSYREYCGDFDFEVCHITEFIAKHLDRLKFREWKKRVTYHDPCRLGRGMGIYDAPREILMAIPGIELVEMKNTRELSLCCGTSCWINCNRYSKMMQVNRLHEAAATGAEILITTCWECAIHFYCAIRPEAWRQVSMDIKDLVTMAASLSLE